MVFLTHTYIHIYIQAGRQADRHRQADRQTCKHTCICICRQTDTHTYIHTISLGEKIYQNSYKKPFDLIKRRYIRKFEELISKRKGLIMVGIPLET